MFLLILYYHHLNHHHFLFVLNIEYVRQIGTACQKMAHYNLSPKSAIDNTGWRTTIAEQ